MTFEKIFVTVGTTEFDRLVSVVTSEEAVKALKKLGCKSLTIQIGRGKVIPSIKDVGISFDYYDFKDSIAEDIAWADLVISHAGAGTSLDVLENGKPLITVVNDELMNNHQTELAEKLAHEGHSICCNCGALVVALSSALSFQFRPFNNDFDRRCALYIEKVLFGDNA